VLDQVVDGVALLVAVVEGQQHLLDHLGQLVAELGGGLAHLPLVQARGQQRPLDVVVVELRLGLGDPAQVLPVHPRHPDQHPVVQPHGPAEPGAGQQVPVEGVDGVVRLGTAQPRGLVDPLHQGHRQLQLGAELLVGGVGQRPPGQRHQVQEGEGQPPGGDRLADPLQRQPGSRQASASRTRRTSPRP
jgi:hypothetical protein